MIRKSGKVFDDVAKLLKEQGLDVSTLEVAALGPGTDRLVLLNGEVVGDYNHRSKSLFLYSDLQNAPE